MNEIMQKAIEAGARAACEADGYDPDEHVIGGQAQAFEDYGQRWQAAQRGLAADTDYVALASVVLLAALPVIREDLLRSAESGLHMLRLAQVPADGVRGAEAIVADLRARLQELAGG